MHRRMFLFKLCVYVLHTCMCLYVYRCMCLCIYHVWRPEVGIQCHLLFLLTSVFETGSLTEPGDYWLARLASHRGPGILLSSASCTEITDVCHLAWLFTWVLVIQTQDLILQSSPSPVPALKLLKAYFANTYRRLLFFSSFFFNYYISDLRFYFLNYTDCYIEYLLWTISQSI